MSNSDMPGEGTWMPLPPPIPTYDKDEDDQPEAVTAEEAFLDAIVSHSDDEPTEIEALREKVSANYASSDETTRKGAHVDKGKDGIQEVVGQSGALGGASEQTQTGETTADDADLPLGGFSRS